MSANDPRSPTTSSSTPSPPSNGTRSSSSSSPSPPRSSASPPDELLQLKLEDDEGRELPEGRHQRTVPRGKAKLDPVTVDESASILLEEELELVAIGPSSSTEGWNRTHLSYALTHHLVETCLTVWHTMTFAGVHVLDFRSRSAGERGRTSELSFNDQLLSLVCMGLGAQLTEHTAILGTPPSSSAHTYEHLGLCRRAPLLGIIDQITQRLEDDQQLDLDSTAQIDHLGLSWMALEQLHMPDSPQQRRCIIEIPAAPPALYTPDDTAVGSIFLAGLESHPTCVGLFGRTIDNFQQFFDHLDYIVAYAPRDKLPSVASYVWTRLSELGAHCERQFHRVFDDERYATLPPDRQCARPVPYFGIIFQFETSQLRVLWGMHLALLQLIIGLKQASNGLPEAARLVQLLEGEKAPTSSDST
ncbi:hypothetical protein JCM6882_002976 [Rhodosporidiobolus microsporus]